VRVLQRARELLRLREKPLVALLLLLHPVLKSLELVLEVRDNRLLVGDPLLSLLLRMRLLPWGSRAPGQVSLRLLCAPPRLHRGLCRALQVRPKFSHKLRGKCLHAGAQHAPDSRVHRTY